MGCFYVDPVPATLFRLRCRMTDGFEAETAWVAL